MKAVDFSFTDLAAVGPLTIVDVGAAAADKPPSYQALGERTGVELVGFEPDRKACAALNAKAQPGHSYFPFCIGAGGPAKLYETTEGITSSLYPPNAAFAQRFTNLAGTMVVKQVHDVETFPLDEVVGADEVDFLKIDVQGAELDVLRGATRLLENTLVVEAEVEFVPMYLGQPLFSDVDAFMRAAGFQLHTFPHLNRLLYTPMAEPGERLTGLTQVMWADAIYIPDVTTLTRFSRERLLKLVAILHDIYGSYDLCAHILAEMRARGLDAPSDAYIRKISGAATR